MLKKIIIFLLLALLARGTALAAVGAVHGTDLYWQD